MISVLIVFLIGQMHYKIWNIKTYSVVSVSVNTSKTLFFVELCKNNTEIY